ARQERQTPSPGQHVFLGQHRNRAHRERRQDQAWSDTGLRQAAEEALLALWRVLDRHQHRPAPLAAYRNALQEAHDDEQQRGPVPDRVIGRHQADQNRRYAHQVQRHDEHGLSSYPVTEVTENHAAERAGKEADRIGRKRRQRARNRVKGGEENLIKNQRSGSAVEKEVVPLDGGTDQAGQPSRDMLLPGLPLGSRQWSSLDRKSVV